MIRMVSVGSAACKLLLSVLAVAAGVTSVSAQVAVYNPKRSDQRIESSLARELEKKTPRPENLTNFAMEFGRNGNQKRQDEVIERIIDLAVANNDIQEKAQTLVRLATTLEMVAAGSDEPKIALNPKLMNRIFDSALHAAKEIKDAPKKYSLLRDMLHPLRLAQNPELILAVADQMPSLKEAGLERTDAGQENDFYHEPDPKESAIKEAALIYARQGNAEKAKKLVLETMSARDAADTLRYFPDGMFRPAYEGQEFVLSPEEKAKRRREAAEILAEAAQLTKKIAGSDNMRGNALGQVIPEMCRYGFFDEAYAAAETCAPESWKKTFVETILVGLNALPESRFEKIVAEILRTKTRQDGMWWQAKTVEVIAANRDDVDKRQTALTELIVDSLSVALKDGEDEGKEKEEEETGFDLLSMNVDENEASLKIVAIAVNSKLTKEIITAADAVVDPKRSPETDRLRRARMLGRFALMYGVGSGTLDLDVMRDQANEIATRFESFDLDSSFERMIVMYTTAFFAETGDAGQCLRLIDRLVDASGNIRSPRRKEFMSNWIENVKKQVGAAASSVPANQHPSQYPRNSCLEEH